MIWAEMVLWFTSVSWLLVWSRIAVGNLCMSLADERLHEDNVK